MITFKPLKKSYIREKYKSFYHRHGYFYALVVEGKEVGFLGLKKLSTDNVEMSFYIFEPFRGRILSKEKLREIVAFVEGKGWKRLIMGTNLRSLQRLCLSFGFQCVFSEADKVWFIKEKET